MELDTSSGASRRYKVVSEQKASGATYTPSVLADFVAEQIARTARFQSLGDPLRVLDPAIGDGALLISLLEQLERIGRPSVQIVGYEKDSEALERAINRITARFPAV